MKTIFAFALTIVSCVLLAPTMAFAADDISYERDFVSGPFGQVHIITAQPAADVELKTPLVLLHPTPYSSDYFKSFIGLMASDRIVIAMDTPGYGDSAKPSEPQAIESYARSAAVVLEALGYGKERAVDILGYHTGTLIAAELAIMRAEMVRRLVLPGVPFYVDDSAQREAYEKYVKEAPISKDGSHLTGPWEFSTMTNEAGVPLERSQAHFNDYMQCYPDCWYAYHGVFSYDGKNALLKSHSPRS